MTKITLCLAILLLSIGIHAQESTAPGGPPGAAGHASAVPKSGSEIPAEKAAPVSIPKLAIPVVIDGRPDEDAWTSAAIFKDFYQTSPGNNTAPSKPTEARIMYDEHNLYISFKCWDEKDKIRATLAKRDGLNAEDNVRVWLDTYNDRRRAYVLWFNPLGIQQDGIYTEGQGADFSVDIVMESKGVIEDWGWSVEAKIPFKSLRYRSGKGVFWGFNAARTIQRLNGEFDQWLPDDRNVSGFLIKHGKITGLDEIKYERTLEIVPSVTLSESGNRVPAREFAAGRFINEPIKKQIGVTLKYTLSPSVTIDAAVNPDFAEIEADARVVTANQRFPIFFEEKRPFFLEGADIFRSPLQVFYSRNIIDPDLALKVSGKLGKTSYGILAASDNAPGNYTADERTSNSECLVRQLTNPRLQCTINEFVNKNSLFGVIRVKRDFGAENNIGFFTTYRTFPEQKNLLNGFDGRIKWSPAMTSTFQVVGTSSKRCFFDPSFEPTLNYAQAASNRSICGTGSYDTSLPITDPRLLNSGSTYRRYQTGNGLGYYFNLDYSKETRGWMLEAGGRSKYYRADSGFTRRTNTNFLFFFNRFSTKSKPKAKIIRAGWNQMAGADYDWRGRLQGFNTETNGNLILQNNLSLNWATGTGYEKIYEEEFGLKRSPTRPLGTFYGDPTRAAWYQFASANINHSATKRFNYGLFVGSIRNAMDYFSSTVNGLQNPGPGLQVDANIYFEVKPIDPLRFSVSYNKSRLTRKDTLLRSFDSDIVTVKSTYQFTRFLFTRFRLDYDGTEKNFAGQALVGWAPNPGTAFYVGYNDNLTRSGFNPYTGSFEPGFQRNGRTFFIRASYLFRKSF